MPETKIFTKNYVSADDSITVSHGDGAKAYLYDRDNASCWLSSGADDDTTQITIEIVFKEGSTAVNRTIDSLFLINHNLKNWILEYWDGSAWQTLTSETVDDEDVTFKSFAEQTTAKVRLTCDEAQAVDAEKFIGEMIICALRVDLGDVMMNMERRDRERTKEIVLGDGSEHRMTTLWTKFRSTKYGMRGTMLFVDEPGREWAEIRLAMKTIVEERLPFLIQAESILHPDEIFLVRADNPWSERYISPFKGAGIEVPLEVSEV